MVTALIVLGIIGICIYFSRNLGPGRAEFDRNSYEQNRYDQNRIDVKNDINSI